MMREFTGFGQSEGVDGSESDESRSPQRAAVRGIVLAGCHTWGRSLLEQTCSRPLLPVAGRPLIWYALNWIRGSGIREASVCANSDTGQFRRYLGSGESLGLAVDYYEDMMPRGPAGCLRDAALSTSADTFVVVEGTQVPRLDLSALLEAHGASGAVMTIVVSSSGRGSPWSERCLAPSGVYVVSRSALEAVPSRGYQDIKEMLVPRLYEMGKRVVPHVVESSATWHVSGLGSYMAACEGLVEEASRLAFFCRGYVRAGSGWAHGTAKISHRARVIGPVLIGPGCTIEDGAAIVGPATIGADSVVRRDAVVTRSVTWSRCEAGPGSAIDGCVLLDGAKVEGGGRFRDTIVRAEGRMRRFSLGRAYWLMSQGGSSDRSTPANLALEEHAKGAFHELIWLFPSLPGSAARASHSSI